MMDIGFMPNAIRTAEFVLRLLKPVQSPFEIKGLHLSPDPLPSQIMPDPDRCNSNRSLYSLPSVKSISANAYPSQPKVTIDSSSAPYGNLSTNNRRTLLLFNCLHGPEESLVINANWSIVRLYRFREAA